PRASSCSQPWSSLSQNVAEIPLSRRLRYVFCDACSPSPKSMSCPGVLTCQSATNPPLTPRTLGTIELFQALDQKPGGEAASSAFLFAISSRFPSCSSMTDSGSSGRLGPRGGVPVFPLFEPPLLLPPEPAFPFAPWVFALILLSG